MEIWKDIEEKIFFGKYSVSNYGRVKRKAHTTKVILGGKTPSNRNYPERMCSIYLSFQYNYYPTVLLYDSKNKKSVPRSIHSLVAKAFLKKETHHQCVNHKDCNKENNHVDNLEWVTTKENVKHAYDNGLFNLKNAWKAAWDKGPVNKKKVYQYTKDGIFVQSFASLKEAADYYNGDYWSVSRACLGIAKTYKKHIWSYELLH